MSLHPSLRVDNASATQKTVLTRIERIKDLMKKGVWVDGQAVIGLPKTKILKIKAAKKEKKAAEGTEGAAGATGAAAPAAGGAKPAAGAKASAPKPGK